MMRSLCRAGWAPERRAPRNSREVSTTVQQLVAAWWRARLVLVVGGGTRDQQVEPAPAPPLLGKAKPSEPSSCAAEKEKLAKCSTSREVEPSVLSLRSLVVFLKSIRSTDVLRNINRTLVISCKRKMERPGRRRPFFHSRLSGH